MSSPMPDPNSPEFPEWVANQSFNLTDITGTSDTFNLPIIDQFIQWTGRSLIIFGLNIGLTAMMTVVLLLLTKPEKRRTPVFALNLSGLILQFLRNVLVSILYDGPTRHIGVFFLGATSTVSTAEISPVYIYTVITMFWYILIISSLVVQVRVVFGAEAKARLYLTLGFALLGLTTVAFVLTQQADIFKFTLEANGGADSWYDWVSITGRILWAIVIGLCSAVFVGKLIYLIHRRQKMGFKGFGPLQVILIMGSQCLIVPLVFVIADFFCDIDGFVTIGETFLTCSLPLSAVWASAEAEKASVIQVKPSFGNLSGTNSSTATEQRPASSKKGLFSMWSSTKGSEHAGTDVEKGSFTDDSDHVMIQRTLEVRSQESPAPRSGPTYRF